MRGSVSHVQDPIIFIASAQRTSNLTKACAVLRHRGHGSAGDEPACMNIEVHPKLADWTDATDIPFCTALFRFWSKPSF
jgi:hypothetical protein